MVTVRGFKYSDDYDTISTWWKKHGSFAPKKPHLSDNGFIVYVDDSPICAGWVYNTDSAICVFEFVVSNPDATKEDRDLGLRQLIEYVKAWSEFKGYDLIYTSINISAYINKLKDSGFIEVDKNQTHMFYEIGN